MLVTAAVKICVSVYFIWATLVDAVRTSQSNRKQQSLSHGAAEQVAFQGRAGDNDHFVPLPSPPAFGSLPFGYHHHRPPLHSSLSSHFSRASNAPDPYSPSTTPRAAATFEQDPLGLLVPWTKGSIDEKQHPYLHEADESIRKLRESPELLEPLLGLLLPWEGETNLQRAWRELLLPKTPTEESKLYDTSNADPHGDFDDAEAHAEHHSIVGMIQWLKDKTATPQDGVNSSTIAEQEATRHSSFSSHLSHASNAPDPYSPTTLRAAATSEQDPSGILVPWTKGSIDEKHHPYLHEADESIRKPTVPPDLLEPLLGLLLPWEGGTNLQRAWRELLLPKTPTKESKLYDTSNADPHDDVDDAEDHDEHHSIVDMIKWLKDKKATPQDSVNSMTIAEQEARRHFEVDMEKRKGLLMEAVRRLSREYSEYLKQDALNTTSLKAKDQDAEA